MCHRVTCWQWPLRSGSAPQWMEDRPHSTHCPHPHRPHPGGHQLLLDLQKTAADNPDHMPWFGRLGSCGPAPASASWLPKGMVGGRAQAQKPLQTFLSGYSPPGQKGRPNVIHQEISPTHTTSPLVLALPCPPRDSCTVSSKGASNPREVLWRPFLSEVTVYNSSGLPLGRFYAW